MYLEMKENAIEKVKEIAVGMEFTPEEVVLLSSNLEDNARNYDKQMEGKLDSFRYSDNFRRYMENKFKDLYHVEKMSFNKRNGNYVIESVKQHYYEAFAELADRQAKAEEEILNKEYTLEQLFIEELKMRKLPLNYADLLQNCRHINAKYDITKMKNGKYKLSKK